MDRRTKAARPAAGSQYALWIVQMLTLCMVLRLTLVHPMPSIDSLGTTSASAQLSKATLSTLTSRNVTTATTITRTKGIDPCAGRPTPQPLPTARDRPPLLYFLHLPKSAGSTVTMLLREYARLTDGVPCAYLQDGESAQPENFAVDARAHHAPYKHLGNNSLESRLIDAYLSSDRDAKLQLLGDGACRTMRGHVTLERMDYIKTPVVLVTVLRDPVERFISMYDYGIKTQMDTHAWRGWMAAPTLADEMANASSVLHLPFYNSNNKWFAENGQWISFFFYGVLHQMSGMMPTFSGSGDHEKFTMVNAADMAEKAMDYMCRMHIIGFQDDVPGALAGMARLTSRWAAWPQSFLKRASGLVVNLTPNKMSRDPSKMLPSPYGEEVRRRLEHEYRVYEFAKRLVEYRGSMFASQVPADLRGADYLSAAAPTS